MKNKNQIRIIAILLTGSLMMGQSFFNPIFGEDATIGSARAAAMGSTQMTANTTSSLLLFNPAGLNWQTQWLAVDYQFHGNSIRERRGYDLKDSFGDYLTTSDYVSNLQNYGFHQFGAIFAVPLNEMNIAVALSYAPLTSFNYRYEEEVRGSQSLEDGEIGIRDPLLGFQVMDIEGQLDMISFGGSFGMNAFDNGRFSFGMGLHSILESSHTQSVLVDTIDWDENYLASVDPFHYEFDTPGDFFFSLGSNFTIMKGLTGSVAYESKAEVVSDDAVSIAFNPESGYPDYTGADQDMVVSFLIQGVDYVRPSRMRLGLSYVPRKMAPMMLTFELEQINTSEKFSDYELQDILQWKFGMEYLALKETPVRAGLIFRESPLQGFSPESIFTFGTGKSFGSLVVDIAGQFSVLGTYGAADLFPVAGETRPEFDQVNEARFDFIATVNYQF